MKFLKTTVIGGVLFLVPIVVLTIVLAKAYGFMMAVAEPMAEFVPLERVGGIALANLIAAAIVLLVCFGAGLLARTEAAKRLVEGIESRLVSRIPGYSFLKGLAAGFSPEQASQLKPVLVSLGPVERVGFEVERIGEDRVTVYLPSSPNAFVGIVQVVASEHVSALDAPVMAVVDHAEQLGAGTAKLLAGAGRGTT